MTSPSTKLGVAKKTRSYGSVKSYLFGYIFSIILTLAAYGLVQLHLSSNHETLSHTTLAIAVFIFAITQLAVQLVFFLHLGREQKPYSQSLSFLFVAFIITVLIVGSLWIMANLDYSHGGLNKLSPDDANAHIIEDEGMHQ